MNATHGYSADAELTKVCEEFEALERAYRANRDSAAEREDPDLERAADEITDRQKVLEAAMLDLPATSRKALRARARAVAVWAPDILDDGGDLSEQLLAAIVRDLVGADWIAELVTSMKIGAPDVRPALPGPWKPADVDLISACVELIRKQELLTRIVDNDSDADVDFDAPEIAKLYADRDELIKRVTNMEATTRAGYVYKSKAAIAVAQRKSNDVMQTSDMFADLAFAALADIAATNV